MAGWAVSVGNDDRDIAPHQGEKLQYPALIELEGLELAQRRVDNDRLERADRESRLAIVTERQIRDAKTARLRAQRLSLEVPVAKSADTTAAGSKEASSESH